MVVTDQRSAQTQLPTSSLPIVEVSGVTKRFGGVHALRGVELKLYAGEVHALLGENGAGKSTLVKILAGVHQPDSGTIQINGEPVTLSDPAAARAAGIAVIHQQPTLFPDLDVAENVYVGRQPRDRFGRVDWGRMYRDVEELLRSLDVRVGVRTPVQGLSVADQQLVEIAKALSLEARVLIMDEPTASLSAREVDRLFAIVRRLRERGVAILFVTHRLEEVFALCDRITIFRDGAFVVTALTRDMTTGDVIRHMVGRQLDQLFPKEPAEIGPVVLRVRGLTRAGFFSDVSFDLRRGEILGWFGLIGAGRTEVAQVIFGVEPADTGTIELDGQPIRIETPRDAMRHGIGYVPEDRHEQGLILEFSIERNITLPILERLQRSGLAGALGFIRRDAERRVAADYAQRLQVKAASLDQPAAALSGGNQQKVVLGKWLATNPKVLILDEPTRGIDIGTKAEVHRMISQLAQAGIAIILISSELPEVLAMSDRLLVFHEGNIRGEFPAGATPEAVMYAATGQNSAQDIVATDASMGGTTDGRDEPRR